VLGDVLQHNIIERDDPVLFFSDGVAVRAIARLEFAALYPGAIAKIAPATPSKASEPVLVVAGLPVRARPFATCRRFTFAVRPLRSSL
jgi:hypothetical protein